MALRALLSEEHRAVHVCSKRANCDFPFRDDD